MSNSQPQQKPSQNPNQSSQSQSSKPDATKSWDKDASAKGMKNEPTSQNRDQSRSDASKK